MTIPAIHPVLSRVNVMSEEDGLLRSRKSRRIHVDRRHESLGRRFNDLLGLEEIGKGDVSH
jgi:hypothetical protein